MARPEDARNSTGPVPEFDYVRHQTATRDGDVQSHDPVPHYWNRVSQHRRYGGLGETGRDIQSPLVASWRHACSGVN